MTTMHNRSRARVSADALDAEDHARNMETEPDLVEPRAMGAVVLLLVAVCAVVACVAAVHLAGWMGWL